MDSASTWHPGATPVDPIWPVPTLLLPDEILSSWLIRMAFWQGSDPLVMTGCLWPGWRYWARDTDRPLSEERLKVLSRYSGVAGKSIQAASLGPIAMRVNGEALPTRRFFEWMLTLGVRNRKREGGLQFCPYCFNEDTEPYFRIQWRFAWHTGCERHRVSLLDRCGHCYAPLEPDRLEAKDGHVALCGSCKGDLRRCASSGLSDGALAFQRAADGVAAGGTGHFLGERLEVAGWFAVARFLVRVVRKFVRDRTEDQGAFLREMAASWPGAIALSEKGMGVEKLPVGDRQELFRVVWPLLQADENRWFHALSESGICREGFLPEDSTIPTPMARLVAVLPSRAREYHEKSGRKEPGPRSPAEVARMMARLERKLARRRR